MRTCRACGKENPAACRCRRCSDCKLLTPDEYRGLGGCRCYRCSECGELILQCNCVEDDELGAYAGTVLDSGVEIKLVQITPSETARGRFVRNPRSRARGGPLWKAGIFPNGATKEATAAAYEALRLWERRIALHQGMTVPNPGLEYRAHLHRRWVNGSTPAELAAEVNSAVGVHVRGVVSAMFPQPQVTTPTPISRFAPRKRRPSDMRPPSDSVISRPFSTDRRATATGILEALGIKAATREIEEAVERVKAGRPPFGPKQPVSADKMRELLYAWGDKVASFIESERESK
jgi:hypothetical protein